MSLRVEGNVFRLCPTYDMCSMAFAPVRGEARPFDASRMDAAAASFDARLDAWAVGGAASRALARDLAHAFRERVRGDGRASEELGAVAKLRAGDSTTRG